MTQYLLLTLAAFEVAVVDDMPGWFELIKATGYLGIVFYLLCIERPRQDSRQDAQAAAHRTEVVAVIQQLADDIRERRTN